MEKNNIYFKCPKLNVDRRAEVYSVIKDWVNSPALLDLIKEFDGHIPNGLSLESFIGWLHEFSTRWDFRRMQREAEAKDIGEGARWLLDDSEITEHTKNIISSSAEVLGLIGISKPFMKHYDYILSLGGAKLSCLLRTKWAFQLVEQHNYNPKAIVLLASSRPISESERKATDTYAKSAKTEFDLINAGAKSCFNGGSKFEEEKYDDTENSNKSWKVRKYKSFKSTTPVIAISAPSTEPDIRRANSADTYEFFFSKLNIPQGSSLLLVTSQIYVPYQQLEAIRSVAIPHNVIMETVGFPADWTTELQGMTGPTNYLQEIRSTIQSIQRFVNTYKH